MSGNPDGIHILEKLSKIPSVRIRYVPDADATTLRSIDRGFLFLMAFWSVPSVKAFSMLTEALKNMQAEHLELVVVDVDGSPELYQLPEFKEKIHGKGEVAFLVDGRIVQTAVLGSGADLNLYETNTKEFLSSCSIK